MMIAINIIVHILLYNITALQWSPCDTFQSHLDDDVELSGLYTCHLSIARYKVLNIQFSAARRSSSSNTSNLQLW